MQYSKAKVVKNTIWLGIGEGFSKLFAFLLMIYAVRILGATEFGIFSFALAFCSLFLIFSNLGLPHIVTRELARDKEQEKDYSAILSLRIFLSIITFIFIFLASFFVEESIRKIIWILGIYLLGNYFLNIIYSFFRARQKMKYESFIKIFRTLITLISGFVLLRYIPSVETLSYVLLGSTLLTIFFVLILFSIFIMPISFSLDFKVWKKFLKISWPLGLTMIFAGIYIYMDSIMMGFWGQITQVGWYSAAYGVAGILMIPSSLIGVSFLPVLSKLFYQSKEEFYRTFKYYIKITLLLAIVLTSFSIVLAPYIINLLYGESFSPAIFAFQILAVVIGLNFIYTPIYIALIAANQQKKIFYISFIAAVVNIILNFILIPTYSLYGAASATLITYIVLVVLGYKTSSTIFKKPN